MGSETDFGGDGDFEPEYPSKSYLYEARPRYGRHASTAIAHPNIALVKYWGKRHRSTYRPYRHSFVNWLRFNKPPLWGTDADRFVNGSITQGSDSSRIEPSWIWLITVHRCTSNPPTTSQRPPTASSSSRLLHCCSYQRRDCPHPRRTECARPQVVGLASRVCGVGS